ncbi:hypothetical protein ACWCQL_30130 [Streptomyces sp. NPDC002073]
MSRPRAEAGDHVKDSAGRKAIVTDIRGTRWVLRPLSGGTFHQWETTDPDTLTVIRRRADRIAH